METFVDGPLDQPDDFIRRSAVFEVVEDGTSHTPAGAEHICNCLLRNDCKRIHVSIQYRPIRF
jgi:hypothetical protein